MLRAKETSKDGGYWRQGTAGIGEDLPGAGISRGTAGTGKIRDGSECVS